jgi:predicted GIY-YIG superfamily endonuclease
MAVRNLDRKFGSQFLDSVPGSPGVYLVYDQQDELIYVGKAKNLKRRLSQYRYTLRRKKHRRMRGIVKEAARIEIQCAETHLDACLTEALLIQKHRPRWNIVGAYSFLYPLIGIRVANGNIEFCMTTTPEGSPYGVSGLRISRRVSFQAHHWRRVLRADAAPEVRRSRQSLESSQPDAQVQPHVQLQKVAFALGRNLGLFL